MGPDHPAVHAMQDLLFGSFPCEWDAYESIGIEFGLPVEVRPGLRKSEAISESRS